MAMRKATKLHAVAVRRRVVSKKGLGEEGEAGNGERLKTQRVIEFPQPPAAEDVVSDTVIFEIGTDRFAMTWSAEIERLPPAGPFVVEGKQPQNGGRSAGRRR